jgi:hypothetical protein
MSRGPEGRQPAPVVTVQFDRAERQYEPGMDCRIRYRIEGLGEERTRAIEHSVLWYTEGKGEEDLGVHFFERLEDQAMPATNAGEFTVRLPASPLSYEGVIVKVRWCVRVRIFFRAARDFVSEHVFDVGELPPARLAEPRTP